MAVDANEQQSAKDDLISLEDLVRDGAQGAAPSASEATAAIDKVLEVEDPTFAQEMKSIQAAAIAPAAVDIVVDSDVEELVQNEKVEKASRGMKRLRLFLFVRPRRRIEHARAQLKSFGPWLKQTALPATKAGAISSVHATRAGLAWTTGKIKICFGWYGGQSRQSKFLIVAVLGLAIAAAAMTRLAVRGTFLPTLEKEFLTSFGDVADQSFTFAEDEKWQDLNDPLLHPEHIVLLERLIVNLKNPGDGTNPMALLDLYVEAGSQDAAVEIKARDAEVRDMVLRTMEQLSYDELVTETGKNKLKVFLRKNLNEMITKGRIRRLFFKSIVVKP